MSNDKKDWSILGITIPINRLYILLSLSSIVSIVLAGKILFYDYEPKTKPELIVLIIALLIIGLVLGGLGFPQWIKEDEEERNIRKMKRRLERLNLEKQIKDIKKKKSK